MCDRISDIGVKDLSKLKNLTHLDLMRCNRVVGGEYFSEFVNLTLIRLLDCKNFTDTGLMSILKLSRLEVIDLKGCNLITDIGCSLSLNSEIRLNSKIKHVINTIDTQGLYTKVGL